MKLLVHKGRTSLLVKLFIQDATKSDGSGLTGLAYNTSGLVCYRARDDDGNAGGTAITLATMTRGTWASGGLVEKDATNMPGVYEFGVPNAALATGSDTAVIILRGASFMAPVAMEFQLITADLQTPDQLLDVAGGVETNVTVRQALRLMAAAILGKSSGLDTTTAVYRDTNDTKNRISATVDGAGNRSTVTLDPS